MMVVSFISLIMLISLFSFFMFHFVHTPSEVVYTVSTDFLM